MKKMNFCQDQRGTRREKEERCFVMHVLCFQSKSFIYTSFFKFGINTDIAIPKMELAKISSTNELTKTPNMNLEDLVDSQVFFGSRWKRGHVTDCKDTL